MAAYSPLKDITFYDEGSYADGSGYRVLKCARCEKVELESYDFFSAQEPECFNFRTLYPPALTVAPGLPQKVRKEYIEAMEARTGNPNAYGVLMGRVVDAVCKEKRAKGKMIGSQISDLEKRGKLPPDLATLAFRLNDLRIIGAHVKPRDLKAKHIPLLENLVKALFESLYSGPYHVQQAKKALRSLTRRKRKRQPPGSAS